MNVSKITKNWIITTALLLSATQGAHAGLAPVPAGALGAVQNVCYAACPMKLSEVPFSIPSASLRLGSDVSDIVRAFQNPKSFNFSSLFPQFKTQQSELLALPQAPTIGELPSLADMGVIQTEPKLFSPEFFNSSAPEEPKSLPLI